MGRMFPLETAFQAVDVEGWRAEAQCMGELSSYFFAPGHFERKPEKDARENVARQLCGAARSGRPASSTRCASASRTASGAA